MEKINLFSVTKAKAGFHALKGFFKFDSPTGETNGCGNPQLYQYGEKGNETVCDESHAKQDEEKVTPWF